MSNVFGYLGVHLLTLILVVAKLTGLVILSWWWVLAPTWVPLVLLLPVVICYLIWGRHIVPVRELWSWQKNMSAAQKEVRNYK